MERIIESFISDPASLVVETKSRKTSLYTPLTSVCMFSILLSMWFLECTKKLTRRIY